MDTKVIDQIVVLREREAALSAELKEVRTEIEERSPAIVDAMIKDGLQNMRRNGRTIYLRTTTKAFIKDMDHLIRRLRRRGDGSMVRTQVNFQTITAYVREREENGEVIPKSILECLDVQHETSIRVKKS